MIEDIDYVEMYVEDVRQAASFFCSAYGFRVMAEAGPETGVDDHRSLILDQGQARLMLTSALSPEHPAAEFVRLHGDGVRDVAFRTQDVKAAFDRALQAGARGLMEPTVLEGEGGRVIQAKVSSPVGDGVHSLIHREREPEGFLPGYRPLDVLPLPATELFTWVDHVAMCLEPGTLDATMGFYQRAFGFRQSHEENILTEYSGMNSRVTQNESGRICFPMQEPMPGRRGGQLDEFLRNHGGAGVQHLALLTPDICRTLTLLRERGVGFLETPDSYYDVLPERVGLIDEPISRLRKLDILVDRDSDGYLLQIFAKSVHARRTFFLEVIQRKKARGFGSANIKALYEAKERERQRVGA